jgi:transcriptional regulator with XRE-family HTH domain
MRKIWNRLQRKDYRDSYVAAHVSNTIAAQVFLMREREGWTQKQLADKTGMRQSRISALEDPNYENFEVGTLRRLASAFDVALTVRFEPFSALVLWTEDSSPSKFTPVSFAKDHYPIHVSVASGSVLLGTSIVSGGTHTFPTQLQPSIGTGGPIYGGVFTVSTHTQAAPKAGLSGTTNAQELLTKNQQSIVPQRLQSALGN